jgi:large subunit ribosomal protein L30
MKSDMRSKLIAVVRVRGRVKVRGNIQETLDRLRLKKPNNCVVVKATDSYIGMINKANDYIAYGEIDSQILDRILKKYGIQMSAESLNSSPEKMAELKQHLPFRLRPPSRGYRNIKFSYKDHGALGYMGKEINGLLARMI